LQYPQFKSSGNELKRLAPLKDILDLAISVLITGIFRSVRDDLVLVILDVSQQKANSSLTSLGWDVFNELNVRRIFLILITSCTGIHSSSRNRLMEGAL
jgi:hypothetical protein